MRQAMIKEPGETYIMQLIISDAQGLKNADSLPSYTVKHSSGTDVDTGTLVFVSTGMYRKNHSITDPPTLFGDFTVIYTFLVNGKSFAEQDHFSVRAKSAKETDVTNQFQAQEDDDVRIIA